MKPRGKAPPATELREYAYADAAAIQAVFEGRADEHQQRRAMRFIVDEIADTYNLPYRPGPDGDRETCVAAGRMFVGQALVTISKLNLAKVFKGDFDATEHGR